MVGTDFRQVNSSGNERHVSEVRRVTGISLAANLALSALKFATGILGNSQAVVADAVHSLSDSVTDIAVLVGVKFWSKPPDHTHPHGHWRIEFLVTALIGLLLATAALALAYNALIICPISKGPPEWIAFVAAIISIFAKELLYRWTISVGKRIKSAALIANAWHHRSDGLSSIPAAIAVAGAVLVPSLDWLDRVGALVISIFILHAAWKIVRPSLDELVDKGAPEEVLVGIKQIAIKTQGVEGVHAIRTRNIGCGVQVDLHIVVDPSLSVEVGHQISEEVKRRLIDYVSDVVDVMVHLEPRRNDGKKR